MVAVGGQWKQWSVTSIEETVEVGISLAGIVSIVQVNVWYCLCAHHAAVTCDPSRCLKTTPPLRREFERNSSPNIPHFLDFSSQQSTYTYPSTTVPNRSPKPRQQSFLSLFSQPTFQQAQG